MQDSTHSIFSSAKRFFTGTMLSRVTGLARDVAMAGAFGTQDAVAAFLVAFRFSHLLRRLLGEGALQTAFIPHFEALRKESPSQAGAFFRDLTALLSLVLSVLVIVSMLAIYGVLLTMDLSEGNQEILWLTLLMMPSLLFICLYGLNAALLQCEKNYFIASAAPIAFNVVWTLGVLCLWNIPPPQAMPWLAGFIIAACLGQWLATVPHTVQILRSFSLQWKKICFFSQDVKRLLKPLFLGILGISAAQINNALDAVFARYADAEGPAFLWYAIRVQQLPLALFGIALSGALLPPLSRAIKNQDIPLYKQFLEFALRRSVAFMLPITAGIFLLGTAAIRLIYGRGDFSTSSVLGTTQCLWGYGFGLIPMTLVLIMSPAFYALKDYRTPTIASLAAMGANITLNTLLVAGIGWGAASIAWATSVSAWLNVAILGWYLWQRSGSYLTKGFWMGLGKVSLATASGAASVLLFQGYASQISEGFVSQLVHFTSGSITFMLPFVLVAWGTRCEELHLRRS